MAIIQFLIIQMMFSSAFAGAEGSPNQMNELIREAVQWETASCSCRAKVDVQRLKPEFIRYIAEDFQSFQTPKDIDWWDFRDASVDQLNRERERFKQQSARQIGRLTSLELPADSPITGEYHAQTVRGFQVDAHLYLAELDFLITGKTDNLKKNFMGGKVSQPCRAYAQTIETKEETFKRLPEFLKLKCSNNANPKRCEEKSLAKAENDFKSAQLEFLIFGWHNCINYQLRKDEVYDYTYRVFEELDQFMTDRVCECDEP